VLPEFVVDLIKGTAITVSMLIAIIGCYLSAINKGTTEYHFPVFYAQSMRFGKISFCILLPIQSLIILFFGIPYFPSFLYLGYMAMSLVMMLFVIESYRKQIPLSEVKLSQRRWLEVLLKIVFVFEFTGFFFGAFIMGIIIANRL
jgi:hypothetical protein